MKLTHPHAVWLMVAVTLMWSIAGVVTRQLETARSFEVTFWRSFFTAVSLWLVLPVWQGRQLWHSVRHGPVSLWGSALCWSGMFTFFMLAMTMTSVGRVLIVSALGPLITALLAWLFLRQPVRRHTWAAMVVAAMGMAWMFGEQALAGDQAGTLVACLVPLSAACNWVVVQHAHTRGTDIDLIPSVAIGALISALVTLPLAWPLQATGHDIELLALLGVVQLALPCTLLVVCARVLQAPQIALLGQMEVLFGIALAWLGAGEVPAPPVLQGGTVVLVALLINEYLGWRSRP